MRFPLYNQLQFSVVPTYLNPNFSYIFPTDISQLAYETIEFIAG